MDSFLQSLSLFSARSGPRYKHEEGEEEEEEDDDDEHSVLDISCASTSVSDLTAPTFEPQSSWARNLTFPFQASQQKNQQQYQQFHQDKQRRREMNGLDHSSKDLLKKFDEAVARLIPKAQQPLDQALRREASVEWMDRTTTTNHSHRKKNDSKKKLCFIRAEQDVVDRAAHRYAYYWERRLVLWGPSKAFRPLTQAEVMSSSTHDIDMLACGFIRPIPGFERVLYMDPSKIVIKASNEKNNNDDSHAMLQSALRSAWYVMEKCLMRSEDMQYHGAILVVNWTRSGTTLFTGTTPKAKRFHKALLLGLMDLMSHVLPIRWTQVCCMLVGSPPGWGWAMDWWFQTFLVPPKIRSQWQVVHCDLSHSRGNTSSAILEGDDHTESDEVENDREDANLRQLREWTGGVELRHLRQSSQDEFYQNWLAEARFEEQRAYHLIVDAKNDLAPLQSRCAAFSCFQRRGSLKNMKRTSTRHSD